MLAINGYIFATAALIVLLAMLRWKILRSIAAEHDFTLPAAAWVDLWLPLILTAPLVIAIIAARSEPESARFEVWYTATPSTIIATFCLGLILLRGGGLGLSGVRAFSVRPAGVLGLLGAILALASLGDQFTFVHGQIFLLSGVLWMWMNSPQPSRAGEARKEVQGKRRRLILDGGGVLNSPISFETKLVVLLALGCFWLAVRFLLPLGLGGAVCLGAGFQGAGFLCIWRYLGRGSTLRCLLSTLIFTILFGLGSMAMTRLGGNLAVIFNPDSVEPIGAMVLFGLSSLRATGILIVGLGMVTFLFAPTLPDKAIRLTARQASIPSGGESANPPRALVTGVILLAGALLLTLTANRALLNEAGIRFYEIVIPILESAPTEDRDETPAW